MRTPCLSALCAFLCVANARAVLITFDDLTNFLGISNSLLIPPAYNGFEWSNFNGIDGPSAGGGYNAGIMSGRRAAYNGSGLPAFIRASGGVLFDFNSAYVTAAWRDELTLNAIGSLGGVPIYSGSFILSATTPTFINFNFIGIDRILFSTEGGTYHAGYDFDGTQAVFDNVTVNNVPDGGSTALLLYVSLLSIIITRSPWRK